MNANKTLKNMLAPKILTGVIALSAVMGISLTTGNTEASASTANTAKTSYNATKYVYSSDGALNMRKGASVKFQKVGTLKNNQKVKIKYKIKRNGSYWYYGTVGNKKGWMNAHYLVNKKVTKKSTSKSKITKTANTVSSDVIDYGLRFKGVPYVWGGTTPNGFDCSGFTSYVFRNEANKIIPRTAAAQYAYSQKISHANAEPGDLVFFSNSGSRVTHVAIYAGNNRILHASSSKGVNMGYIYDGYWNKRLVGFGRIN